MVKTIYNGLCCAYVMLLTQKLCSAQDCTDPGTPTNGNIAGTDFTDGATVTFACDSGYDLVGAVTLTCSGGTWDNSIPSCNIKDCGSLATPSNAQDSGSSTTYGSSYTHSCVSGYTQAGGDTTRTCQSDGTWSGSNIVCNINDCGSLTTPSNAQVDSGSTTTYGSSFTHSCVSGYTQAGGDTTRTCQAAGTWSGFNIIVCTQGSGSDNGSQTFTSSSVLLIISMLAIVAF